MDGVWWIYINPKKNNNAINNKENPKEIDNYKNIDEKNYVIIDSIERQKNLAKKDKAELYNAIKKIKIWKKTKIFLCTSDINNMNKNRVI